MSDVVPLCAFGSELWVLIVGFDIANQAEFHEFNFGYDVVGESERLLERLLVV